MPGQPVARRLLDGTAEGRDDGVDLLGDCVGGNAGLGLDIPKGAFLALEGLHHVDDVEGSRTPADREEGQDGLGVWSGLVPDPNGDQDAVEPVVGLKDEGWGRGLVGAWDFWAWPWGDNKERVLGRIAGTQQPHNLD